MKLRFFMSSFFALALVASAAFSQTDGVIYDNGQGALVNTGLSSQIAPNYPFESATADDFNLAPTMNGLNWDVTGISFTGLEFNGPPSLPQTMDFVVGFYLDDGTGTAPFYSGGVSPITDAFYSETMRLTAGQPAPGPYSYGGDFSSIVKLNFGEQYWVSIQAVADFPPQYGWQGNNLAGGNGVQGFPLLGLPYWTATGGTEMDFRIHGREKMVIPEPVSALVLLGGLVGFCARRRR